MQDSRTAVSGATTTGNGWKPYGDDGRVLPWHNIPGCEDWRDDDRLQAVNDGAKLYREPDIAEVRAHNVAARAKWEAEQEPKRRENLKISIKMPRSRKRNYALGALDSIADELCKTPDGQRYHKTGNGIWRLAGFHNDDLLTQDEIDDAIREASRCNGYDRDEGIEKILKDVDGGLKKATRGVDWSRVRWKTTESAGKNTRAENTDATGEFEPTTWEPVDLEPCLRGEKTQPQPCLGMHRSDGVQLIYPGREHVVLGDTEAGKSWYALGCVVVELMLGNTVVYIHYEEPDETSTIERLLLLGVDKDVIRQQFRFIGPMRPVRKEWLQQLIDMQPSLVVHDGVNEAMSLQGNGIKDVEGASLFRRTLVLPFTRSGAATLACDHMPMIKDGSRVEAYGSVHKGNALDGTRIQLENSKPFGREKRGLSWMFVTKDRPGYLRQHGKPTETPGKTFMGTLVVDDMTQGPNFLMKFYAPRTDDDSDEAPPRTLADDVHDLIYALPDHTVSSERILLASLREAGHKVRNTKVKDAIDDLIVSGRLAEQRGKHGAKGYQAKTTASHGESDGHDGESESDCVPSQ